MEAQLYRINLIDDGIYLLALAEIKYLGTELIVGTFEGVLAFLNDLKENTQNKGEGELVAVDSSELTDIIESKWFLVIDKEVSSKYKIIQTSGNEVYSLPTNQQVFSGSLDYIIERIIELENG